MVAIKSIAALFTAITLVSGAVVSRDVPAILADYQTLSSNIAAFNTAVTSFKGDIGTGLAVSTAATALDNSVKKTTTDINAVPPFSVADSSNIASQSSTLANAVIASLNGLNAQVCYHFPTVHKVIRCASWLIELFFEIKAAAFKKAGFAGIVVSQLNTLHTDNAAFATALEAKVQSADLGAVRFAVIALDSAFNTTSATFSS